MMGKYVIYHLKIVAVVTLIGDKIQFRALNFKVQLKPFSTKQGDMSSKGQGYHNSYLLTNETSNL